MKIKLESIMRQASSRPAGYVNDVLASASAVTETHCVLSGKAFRQLCEKYRASHRPKTCPNCGGKHDAAKCPIPADTSPAIERDRARRGGCCGKPTAD